MDAASGGLAIAGLVGGYFTAKLKRDTEKETFQMKAATALLERVDKLEEQLESAHQAEIDAAVLAEKLETKERHVGHLKRELAEAQAEIKRLKGKT